MVQKSRAVGRQPAPAAEGRAGGRAAAHQSARAVGGGDRRARAHVVAAATRPPPAALGGGTPGERARHRRLRARLPRELAGARPRSAPDAAGATDARRRRAGRGRFGRVRRPGTAPADPPRLSRPRRPRRWPGAAPPWSGSTSRSPRRPRRTPTRRSRRPSASSRDGGLSRVVLLGPLDSGSWPLSAAALGGAVLTASPSVPVDDDGVIRRIAPLPPAVGGRSEPTLALADGRTPRAGSTGRRLADGRVHGRPVGLPLPAGASWPISYVGPAGSFLTIPSDAVAALGDAGSELAADNPLRGRVVLVGGTFPEGRDTYQTPHGLMPGVEVHANVVYMLLSGHFIRPSSWGVSLAINVGGLPGGRRGAAGPAPADRDPGLRGRRADHRGAGGLPGLRPRRLLDRLRPAGAGDLGDRPGQRRAQPPALPRLVRALPVARRDGPGAERRAEPAGRAPRGVDPVLRPARLHDACPSRWSRSGSPRTSTSTSRR